MDNILRLTGSGRNKNLMENKMPNIDELWKKYATWTEGTGEWVHKENFIEAIAEIISLPVEPPVKPEIVEWISIKNKLPEVGIYLVVAGTEPLVAFWYGDIWLSSEGGEKINVSHWMPLPEPPK